MNRILFCLVTVVCLQACETVAPWERGTLARDEMQWHTNDPEHRLRDQVYVSKEASSGGGGAAGGGCGCN